MENLQDEVQRILEKCAKYKVGQTVYCIRPTMGNKCSYTTAVVVGRILDYDNYCKTYSIWYNIQTINGCVWSEEGEDLSPTLDELKESMVNKHLRIAEMWKNPIDDDADEEEAGDGMDD